MSLEDFQSLDNEPIDISIMKRFFENLTSTRRTIKAIGSKH